MTDPSQLVFEASRVKRRSVKIDLIIWGALALVSAGVVGFIFGDQVASSRPRGSQAAIVISTGLVLFVATLLALWARPRLRFSVRFMPRCIVIGQGWTACNLTYDKIVLVSREQEAGHLKGRMLIQGFRHGADVLLGDKETDCVQALIARCPRLIVIEKDGRVYFTRQVPNEDGIEALAQHYTRAGWAYIAIAFISLALIAFIIPGVILGDKINTFEAFYIALAAVALPFLVAAAASRFRRAKRARTMLSNAISKKEYGKDLR